jgi:hypothetical protein
VLGDALDVALQVARALEQIGAGYFLGGSLASSLQGEPRATNDIDFVVKWSVSQVTPFASALGPDFAVDEDALRDAIRRGGSFNIYYLPLVTKIDLFTLGREPFDASEFARRRPVRVRADGSELYVKSPEDTVLRKLLWYQAGGEVSSTQWRDVVEVLRVSGPLLDRTYLAEWAGRLHIDDLLTRAEAVDSV